MSKIIKTTCGTDVIVDDEDFEYLNQWEWHLNSKKAVHKYAERKVYGNGKQKHILMHRLVNKTPEGLMTDHINHNTLDNRKSNLKTVTSHSNQLNRKGLQSNNKSGHSNVSWHKSTKKWQVSYTLMGKQVYIGVFENKNQAIKVAGGIEDER
jgi:hypothetical protein